MVCIVYNYYLFNIFVSYFYLFFFFQAEDGIRDVAVTGVQTCALPISRQTAESSAPAASNPCVRRESGGRGCRTRSRFLRLRCFASTIPADRAKTHRAWWECGREGLRCPASRAPW